MARQAINLGAAPADGTGTPLRTGGDYINDNFLELYNTPGWGFYADAETTPATQSITTTPSKLQIDGGGATSESGYLPREIRGSAELWDTTNDKITPISVGDSYDVRVSVDITAKTGSPNVLVVVLDIGGAAGITMPVSEFQIPVVQTVPFTATVAIPIFTLSTFLTNGGQLFLSTDAGTLTIETRNVLIKRDYNGSL